MRAIRALTILAVLAIFANSSFADYHYASHQGSNTYPYTSWATATNVIQDAVDAASPGDTIYIASGEFADQQIFISSDTLSIIGRGIDSTFLWNETGSDGTIHSSPNTILWIYIEGLNIQNRTNYYCIRMGNWNNLHVNQCKFTNSWDISQGQGIGTAAAPESVVIENCVFDSIKTGIYDLFLSNKTSIENCIFTNFFRNAIQIDNHYTLIKNCVFAHQIINVRPIFGDSDTLLFRNNLVYDVRYISSISSLVNEQINNTFDLTGEATGTVLSGGLERLITNNSISNAEEFTYLVEGAYLHMAYNNFWNVDSLVRVYQGGILDTTGGNIRQNPMFMGNDDYHLQAYSPLIDAGDPSILDPDSSRSDIGVYGGPGGDSYLYIDLPPAIPVNITGEYLVDSVVINWRYNTEADFDRYYLHRDTISGFQPNMFNLIAEPDTSYYVDSDIYPGRSYFYKIAALDDQNNISGYSEELVVVPTDVWQEVGVETPEFTSITSNYPNPFNSQTIIEYYVANLGPIPAQINIDIYDILGRKVRTLVSERKEVGEHMVHWDGKDDSGNECPSGLYFARISQWNIDYLDSFKKLVLIR